MKDVLENNILNYWIHKVKDAVAIAKEKFPELHLDGELQADAALVPEVAAKKAPKPAPVSMYRNG